ncbi:MAG: tetratricopeptide repeat protein [Planctomycetota bacterium]|jgi:tetratricopeptide (TPR) repeat protein
MQGIAIGVWLAAITVVLWARKRMPIVVAKGSAKPLIVMAVVFAALLALIGPDKTHFWLVLALPPAAVLVAAFIIRGKVQKHQRFWALLHAERFEEALALVRPEIEKRPSAAAYNQLGLIHYQKQEWSDAIEAFGRALEEPQGDTPVVRANLGLARYKAGSQDDGIAMLEAARDAMPNELSTRLNLAIVYAEVGRREEAKAELAVGEEIAAGPVKQEPMVIENLLVKAREACER